MRVMDGTGGRTGGILPITGQAGGPEEAVRERVPSTGIGSSYLGMLAIQGFGDMREQARDTMIRDKFIVGQEQCALRRQLDGFAQGTPIGEIVDSCRVWESHSDLNWIAKTGYDSENGDQSGDARTRTRKKVGGMMEEWEPEIEEQRSVQELCAMLWQYVEPVAEPPTGINMVNLEHVRTGGGGGGDGVPVRDHGETRGSRKWRRRTGNEQRFGRVGQPLGPLRIKAPLTLGGVPSRLKKGCPLGRRRKMMGVAAEGRWMIRNSQSWGRRGRPERSPDRPIPMTPRGTGDQVDARYRPLGIRTGECDRRGTFGRFGKGTVMFGRGVSRNP